MLAGLYQYRLGMLDGLYRYSTALGNVGWLGCIDIG